MVFDSLFHTEKKSLRKIALLFTVPCAILPILMATEGMLSAAYAPLLFRYDVVFFGIIYIMYGYGLVLSLARHRKWYPMLFFVLHLSAVALHQFIVPPEWLTYFAIVSIIMTSLWNQYYRVGSTECMECRADISVMRNC